MNGADSTAQIITAIAAGIVAVSIAALVVIVARWLDRLTPEPARRWPDEPALGDWRAEWESGGRHRAAGDDDDDSPVLREEPATLERMFVASHPDQAEPREHVHDFAGPPCWCGWGERIRPYSAVATWPMPPGPRPVPDAETVIIND